MTGFESAALRVGNAVVQHVAMNWLAAKKAETRRGADLTELIAMRFSGITQRDRNRFERKLAEIGDAAGARLEELCAAELPELADNERTAALDAVVDTLAAADLSDTTLFDVDIDPVSLARRVREQVPSAARRAGLDEAGRRLFDLALDQSCVQLVHLVRELPEYDSRLSEEALRRATTILGRVDQLLERLPVSTLDAPDGTTNDEQFKRRYLDLVARTYDDLELIGVSVRNYRPRTTLSVAYLSLTVQREDPEPSRGTSSDPTRPPSISDSAPNRMRVEPALANSRRVLIRGEAGSGKTTLLRWLAVTAARQHFTGALAAWNGFAPLLVKLRSHVGERLPRPEELLAEPTAPFTAPEPQGWTHRQLSSGSALLLVDGVDELAEDERRTVREWLDSLLRTYPDVSIVVTARPLAAAPEWLAAEGFSSVALQDMAHEDIKRFMNNWHQALLDAAINPSALPFDRKEVELRGKKLLAQLETHEHLRGLASNPLMCAMLCALHLDRGGDLPRDRNGLYEAALEMLLHRRDIDRAIPAARGNTMRYADKVMLLQSIAWWLSLENRSELELDTARALIERTLMRMPNNPVNAREALDHLLERSGVIRSPTEGKIDFVHRTFQEFLTAREASEAGHVNLLIERSPSDHWTEIVIMASAQLNRAQRAELIDRLVQNPVNAASRSKRLALACREAAVDLPPELLDRLDVAARSLIPPKSWVQAIGLGKLGESMLPHFPESVGHLDAAHASMCAFAAGMVANDRALSLLAHYAATDSRASLQTTLFDLWRYFDTERYAATVLQRFNVPDATIKVTEPAHLDNVANFDQVAAVVADLRGHELHGLTVLDRAQKLQEVAVSLTGSVDISPLSKHGGLTRVNLRNASRLESMSALTALPKLYELSIASAMPLDDLSFLSGLAGLEGLSLGPLAAVQDYAPLRRLERLRWLELRDCRNLESLDDIAHLSEIRSLALTGCGTEDLANLIPERFPRLRSLVLNRSPITDIGPLRALPLEQLWLNECPVGDLSPLRDMHDLTDVRLRGCASVRDISVLPTIPRLNHVDVSHVSAETDLAPLTELNSGVIRMTADQNKGADGRRLRLKPGARIRYS